MWKTQNEKKKNRGTAKFAFEDVSFHAYVRLKVGGWGGKGPPNKDRQSEVMQIKMIIPTFLGGPVGC